MEELRTCPVCDRELSEIGFLGHLGGAHKLNAAKFAEEYPNEKPVQKNAKKANTRGELEVIGPSDWLEESFTQGFNDKEIVWHREKVEEIFQQIDRDATQKPRIHSLVSDLIMSMRYNKQLMSAAKVGGNIKINKDLNQAIKEVESRIDSKMKSLGIDRQTKVASRQQSRSTPSSLISAYVDEIQRQPDEVLETLRLEEIRALSEVQVVLEKLYFPHAMDIEPTHLGTENDPGRPAYIPPTIDDIIQRAGVEL